MKKIHLICAARPNFMKIAPLYHALAKQEWCETKIIHTGQHYDDMMSGIFLRQFGLPDPDYNLNIGSGTHAQQTGKTMIAYEDICLNVERPDLLIVVGDVNATVACAIAAKKLGIKIAHLEAGLRSFDRSMPEEINRILTDAICDYLWTPSQDGNENLEREGVDSSKIHMVGNIMIDALCMMKEKIEQSEIIERENLERKKYCLVTLHRPQNVDDPENLRKIFSALEVVDMPIVFPMHPRTRKVVETMGQVSLPKNLMILDPLSYVDFSNLISNASFVVTDSGGVQEETTYLQVPCFTIRPNTERPITITEGTNQLVSPENLGEMIKTMKEGTVPKFWDGRTSERLVALIKDTLV